MAVYSFDGADLKMMLQGAADLLGQSKGEIDALNVFPVPDGDTGTNMYHTLAAALNEALRTDTNNIGLVAEAAARGALVGARGNSGVILSQILYGFAGSLRSVEKASALDIVRALENGAQTAYRAVMSPVEGTILTVVRKSAEGAAAQRSDDLLRLMVGVLKRAFVALQETPETLPVLKQAGVVDAGGKGFVIILEGILRALKAASPGARNGRTEIYRASGDSFTTPPAFIEESITFTYCTELLVKGSGLPLEAIKQELFPHGDCLMVVGEDTLVKVHIHTDHPGLILECCLKYGSLHDLKINNMREQNREMSSGAVQEAPARPFGVVSVGAGEGIADIMKNLGADVVVAGGQTLNPSTEEILKAIDSIPAGKIIVLPNNKNIILAAEQAGRLSRKDITVVPSKSIPQGIAALLTLNSQDKPSSVINKMTGALASVRTGEITRAVRDASYNNLAVKKGEYIGLADGDLIAAGVKLGDVLGDLLDVLIEGEGRLITLYCGATLEILEVEALAARMEEKFPQNDFEVQHGGQPVHELIISVE